MRYWICHFIKSFGFLELQSGFFEFLEHDSQVFQILLFSLAESYFRMQSQIAFH